jgi:hypothetical protein
MCRKVGKNNFGFEFLTLVTMKNTVFWIVAPCNFVRARLVGGTYCFHLYGQRVSKSRKLQEAGGKQPACRLPLSVDDMFLRNVLLFSNYTALQHRNRTL